MKSSNTRLILFIPLPFLLYLAMQDAITPGRNHSCEKQKAEASIFLHSAGQIPLPSADPGFYPIGLTGCHFPLKDGTSHQANGQEISIHVISGTIQEK